MIIDNKDNDDWCSKCDNHHNHLVNCQPTPLTRKALESGIRLTIEVQEKHLRSFVKEIKDFLDYEGFIVQKSETRFNAIDANFLNTNYYYQKLMINPDDKDIKDFATGVFFKFQDKPGVLRRYYTTTIPYYARDFDPKEVQLWDNPRTVSRDNSMGWVCLAGALGYHKEVKIFAKKILKRGSFFQNTYTVKGKKKFLPDFCSFAEWATIVRACYNKPFYLLRLFLDFFFLIDILIKVIKSYFSQDNSTVFHTVSCLYQKKETPTLLSDIAAILYCFGLKRPLGYENYSVVGANLRQYSDYKYDPPIYEVTEELIRKKDFIK